MPLCEESLLANISGGRTSSFGTSWLLECLRLLHSLLLEGARQKSPVQKMEERGGNRGGKKLRSAVKRMKRYEEEGTFSTICIFAAKKSVFMGKHAFRVTRLAQVDDVIEGDEAKNARSVRGRQKTRGRFE